MVHGQHSSHCNTIYSHESYTLIHTTQTWKEASKLWPKAGVLACTMDRSLTMSSVSHTNSVLSWRPHLMPGKNEIDSCVTREHILPQPQLSSYMSMVHLSTPLQLLHMMECDCWAIEMQSFPTALIKNTYFFWAPPFFFCKHQKNDNSG